MSCDIFLLFEGGSGFNFFTRLAAIGNKDTIQHILHWADSTDRLAILTSPIQNNDSGWTGHNCFTCIAGTGNKDTIQSVLDWVNYSLDKGLNLNILFSPINANQFTFFHIVAKIGSTENCINMAPIVLRPFRRSPIDPGQPFLDYFKEITLNNPFNLDNAPQSGLKILLSRTDREQVIAPYIQPAATVKPLALMAFEVALKRV